MQLESSEQIRIALFIVASIGLTVISWRPLHNPRSHGFYRFFAFEAITALMLLNLPFWFDQVLSLRQIASWFLLFWSLVFVQQGFYLLRTVGGTAPRDDSVETYAFEETKMFIPFVF